jgi:hypothetical protein
MALSRVPFERTGGWRVIHFILIALVLVAAMARDAPENLRDLYDSVRAKGHCAKQLAGGFYSSSSGPNSRFSKTPFPVALLTRLLAFCYCGDQLKSSGVIYLQGRNGALANMDVDCDGVVGVGNNGRCRIELSPDTQNVTSFRDDIIGYGRGLLDLNPYVHPYVVFGNDRGTRHRAGWRPFDPTSQGMKPLSVMAVVCPGYKLVYGIWGDTNGDDGVKPMIGEASLALATACGGNRINGGSGMDDDNVLFLGFVGDDAVPGANGANWTATDFDTFERSIAGLGDRLVERIQADGGSGGYGDSGTSVSSEGNRDFRDFRRRKVPVTIGPIHIHLSIGWLILFLRTLLFPWYQAIQLGRQ